MDVNQVLEEQRKKGPLNFETVWAALMETRELQHETALKMQETDRKMQETDRQIKKSFKKLNKQMGELSNRFGEMAEHLVAPGIAKRFNELGYHFDAASPGGYKIFDNKTLKVKAEIDLLLENSKHIIAIEVKATVNVKDIEHHIKRLEILRDYRKLHKDTRKIQGAIAGAIFGNVEKKAALDAGFYVLVQSGDTMKMDIPQDFKPREW